MDRVESSPTSLIAPVPASPQTAARRERGGLRGSMVLIGLGLFVTTMAQTQALGRLPVQFLLKNRLQLSPEAMAGFFALITIPWDLKPLAGLVTDSVPLFGTRRRHYLLISAFLAGAFWLLFGVAPRSFGALLAAAILLNAAMVTASTVTGGLLVEQGQRYRATGRLSALRLVAINAALIIDGPLGGALATRPFPLTAALAGAACFLLVPATLLLLPEPRRARGTNPRLVWAATRDELKRLIGSRTLWGAAGMLLLVQIAPGFVTPLFYYQTNVLHFSAGFIGALAMVSGACGLAGALLYGVVCRRLRLRRLLVLSITLTVVSTMFYLAYDSRSSALWIEAVGGLMTTLAQLPLFDLAARATPRGGEALGYALMMSVWNIGMQISDVVGSWLFDHLQLGFKNLVWLNAATTALVLLVIPWLPARLVGAREGEQVADGGRSP